MNQGDRFDDTRTVKLCLWNEQSAPIRHDIGEKFDQACQQYAEQDAVVSLHQNVRFTYKELQAEVNAFACSLLKLGLKKGDRLAIWSPNCVEWTITQFAAFKAGIILVNLNPCL